jgi:hypothetical protein
MPKGLGTNCESRCRPSQSPYSIVATLHADRSSLLIAPSTISRALLVEPSTHNLITMAPIGDDVWQKLQDSFGKLESRVKELEEKLAHAQGGPAKSSSPSQDVRMILMGPPGAGKFSPAVVMRLSL